MAGGASIETFAEKGYEQLVQQEDLIHDHAQHERFDFWGERKYPWVGTHTDQGLSALLENHFIPGRCFSWEITCRYHQIMRPQ